MPGAKTGKFLFGLPIVDSHYWKFSTTWNYRTKSWLCENSFNASFISGSKCFRSKWNRDCFIALENHEMWKIFRLILEKNFASYFVLQNACSQFIQIINFFMSIYSNYVVFCIQWAIKKIASSQFSLETLLSNTFPKLRTRKSTNLYVTNYWTNLIPVSSTQWAKFWCIFYLLSVRLSRVVYSSHDRRINYT